MIKRSEFEIKAEEGEDGARLIINGDLDIATVPELETELERLLGGATQRLTLDLRGLTFADSSGVRLLIAVSERAAVEGWTLEIVRPAEEAFMVFRISGADVGLPFVDG